MKDAAGGVLPAAGTPVTVIPMTGGGAGSGKVSVVEAARPVEKNEGKITLVDKEKNTQKKAHSFHRASCKDLS